ncbi:hypothetical protein EZV62_016363 [Acer yangbiense]|uniref:Uncharacterized protein n=1 Tax=Acer yangbiense TaxID=1000413 RepID=A0A5C7HNY3_9ROSI|nr:hypothetical protein EZV62_016363 [Acer yangbiense]
MWQLLLAAAAAAGSTGLFAKRFFWFRPNSIECEAQDDQYQKQQTNPFDDDAKYQASVIPTGSTLNESRCEINCENQEGIFRFSSSGSEFGPRSRKNGGVNSKKVENDKRRGRGGGIEVCRRRVTVCLKKRRTSKNVSAKRGSCSSKDSSLFNWGLGVGIMYMMSAGKAEISKLNTTMDETAKVVQELKSELRKRKSSHRLQDFTSANTEKISSKETRQVLIKSRVGNGDFIDNKVFGFPRVDDGEYESSVLTEEQDPEVQEMDQLEAELESELQKLPWYTTETLGHEDVKPNLDEWQSSDYCQSLGVSPSELKQKLSHLLIKQQENQIVDLESELHSAQSKLCEKETELQALKDCVKRLTEFSLSTVSGRIYSPPTLTFTYSLLNFLSYGETEAQPEGQECTREWNCNNQIELESMKKDRLRIGGAMVDFEKIDLF